MNSLVEYILQNKLECVGMAFGILNVILAARGNIWCWLMGIISGAIYVYLNFNWQYYYDTILQLFYVFAGFYGWWKWTRTDKEAVPYIVSWTFDRQKPLLILGTVLSIALGSITYNFLLHSYVTYLDATLTVFSFIATWMMAKKVIENWLWWIVLDIAGIGLYMVKDARPTMVLYFILTLGAVYAWYNWRKQMALQTQVKA